MKARWIITRFEFNKITKTRAFVIMTILGPFLLAAISVLPSLLNATIMQSTASGNQVSFWCPDESIYDGVRSGLEQGGNLILDADSEDDAVAKARSGKAKVAFIVDTTDINQASYRVYSQSGMEITLFQAMEGVLQKVVNRTRMESAGLDPVLLERLQAPVSGKVLKLKDDGKNENSDFLSSLMTGLGFAMLLYMTLLIYGQMIGRAVVGEKQSKTVDTLLSAVSTRDLMFGKILGVGLAGILQFSIWLVITFIGVAVLGGQFGFAVPTALTPANLFLLLYLFITGFFLFGSVFAALGAAAEDDQHLGQLMLPLIMLLVIPMMLVSTIIMNPQAPWVVFLSIFPFTSPIAMAMRITVVAPPLWEVLTSLALLPLTIVLVYWIGARIFRVGILLTGKRHKLGEILRWLKAAD